MPTLADKQKTSEMPDMAFLEFLAEMQEVDGQLVAPTDLMDAQQSLTDNLQAAAQGNSTPIIAEQSSADVNALQELFNILGTERLMLSDRGEKDAAVSNKEEQQ